MSVNRALLAILIIYHVLFLAFLPVGKPPYSEALLGYLAAYPLIYFLYVFAVASQGESSGEGPEVAVGFALLYFLIFAPLFAITHWRGDGWSAWLEFAIGILIFLFGAVIFTLLSPNAKPQERARLIRAVAPLVVLHMAYALAALFADRPVLWYFATYPAALAAAVAGGGRLATLAATAIYLAAYLLNAVPLLLLLIVVPVVWRPAAERADLHAVAERRRG